MDKRSFGRIGEESAALYLERLGYHIIGRNVYVGHAEIDIIAENDDYIIFAEVKTRRQYPDVPSPYGTPAEAVDSKKQKLLTAAADRYILEHSSDKIPRIDVLEVYVSPASENYRVIEIRHFPNAVRKTGKFSRVY